MAAAQCASLRSRLERRVNRVPASKRELLLVDLLAPPPPTPAPAPPAKSAPAKVAPTKATSKTVPVSAPAARKPRPALATASQKALSKPGTTAAKPVSAKDAKSARAKKRGSDEISSEDKENAAENAVELAVAKKRVRAATLKQPAVTKPASTGRATRAASRKTVPAGAKEVLSPKNSNTKQKPATRSVRTR